MSKKSILFLMIIIYFGGCCTSEFGSSLKRNKEKPHNFINLELKAGDNSKDVEYTLYVYLTQKWDEMGLDPDQRLVFFDSLKGSIERRVFARKKALFTLHENFKNYPQSITRSKIDSVNQEYGFYENEAVSVFIRHRIDELCIQQQVE
ncbi:MAG: hypothetical protein R8G66_06205 [Cytophagales bacterium]|nr:hypothetical protein [Cytophagales bacterium]